MRKSQRDELLKQVDKLRRELIANQSEKRSYRELLGMYPPGQPAEREATTIR